jgi:pimeloyl-ACP methyl ester carboxylesterase
MAANRKRHLFPLFLAGLLGCGSSSMAPDHAGGDGGSDSSNDAGPDGSTGEAGDGGPQDGASPTDGAPTDGTPTDGAPSEAGEGGLVDAALPWVVCPQAGDPDAGPLDIWADELGSHTLADRGKILGCVHQASYTKEQVASNSYFGSQTAPTNGYELYIIQYVSEGVPGAPQAVTALLYLPSGGASQIPIVALDHPTSGMGPSCGPTHTPAITDNIAIPLVGLGYAVVATDFGGMGVDNGMTSYLVGASEAASTLDSVRALLTFRETRFAASQLSTDFFVVGHSQGGHAALFTQQLFDPTIGVHLLGSVSFAPGLGNAKDWSDSFNDSSQALDGFDVFPTMSLYSHMLYSGAPAASTWLMPDGQTSLPSVFHDECATIATSLMSLFPTQGDLFTSSFTTAAAACAFTAPCPGFEPWSTSLVGEEPGNFASTAPALVLQGTADTVVYPAQTVCILNRLSAHGTSVQGCGYSGLDHTGVVAGALPDAVRWMAARRGGQTPDVCPAPIAGTCTLSD